MKEYKYSDADIADDILNNLDEARELIEQAETDKLIGDNYAKLLYEDFNNMKDRKELPIKAKILIVDDDEAIVFARLCRDRGGKRAIQRHRNGIAMLVVVVPGTVIDEFWQHHELRLLRRRLVDHAQAVGEVLLNINAGAQLDGRNPNCFCHATSHGPTGSTPPGLLLFGGYDASVMRSGRLPRKSADSEVQVTLYPQN